MGKSIAAAPAENRPAIRERIREGLEKRRTERGIERKFLRLLLIGEREE